MQPQSLKHIGPVLPHFGEAQWDANAKERWHRGCGLLAERGDVTRSWTQILRSANHYF
jgi:hypothetical protein